MKEETEKFKTMKEYYDAGYFIQSDLSDKKNKKIKKFLVVKAVLVTIKLPD